jgi:hypothetical protein
MGACCQAPCRASPIAITCRESRHISFLSGSPIQGLCEREPPSKLKAHQRLVVIEM